MCAPKRKKKKVVEIKAENSVIGCYNQNLSVHQAQNFNI